MDISDTLAPTSDQLDAVDLLGGPRVFTVESVSKGSIEQPVQIHLAEFPRPWRPGKSMRRVLAACWGVDASKYVGRRVRLFCDPDVKFGGEAVGGTRIAALSHIKGAQKVPLLISRGKSAIWTVEPLTDAPSKPPGTTPAPTAEDIAACEDMDTLRGWWSAGDDAQKEAVQQRVDELTAVQVRARDEQEAAG